MKTNAKRSQAVLTAVVLMSAWLTGCAGTGAKPLNTPADLNRDGVLSDAEYRAERARLLRELAAEKAKLRELQARRR